MSVREALAGTVVIAALATGCGRSGAVTSFKCTSFQAQPLVETAGDCLGPPVATVGLNVCHDPSEAQGHGIMFLCVVSPDGRLYKGALSSTEWLEGVGWTRSAAWGDPSTLSQADEARCATAFQPTILACQ
jgi:hypothetical protein